MQLPLPETNPYWNIYSKTIIVVVEKVVNFRYDMRFSASWAIVLILILIFAGQLLFMPPAVHVSWQTETETDSAGFNLYRYEAGSAVQLQLNEGLIVSQGASLSGAAYSFKDRTVKRSKTYVYSLEEVGLDGTAVIHHAFQQTHHVPLIEIHTVIPVLVVSILAIFRQRYEKRRGDEVPAKAGNY